MSIKKWLFSLWLFCMLPVVAESKPTVITLAPHLAEIVFAIGAGEQLLATSEYTDYPEAAKKVRTIGNSHSLSIETIIGLKPDVVLAWRTGNPELQLQRLADLGVNIYYSKPENIPDLLSEIHDIAELLDAKASAETVIEQIKSQVKTTKAKYSEKKIVNVFYQIWHQPLRSVGNDPWLNELLKICGAKNVFSHLEQAYPLVSYEALLLKDPQAILIPSKTTATNETQAQVFEHWQKWPQLSAVKNHQIWQLNPDWLHRFSPRITLGLTQLCESIDKARKQHEE